MSLLALIPARAGSRELKNKNIKKLGGIPLLALSIQACKKAGVAEEIVVASDSSHYLKVALSYGATPLLLPKDITQDDSSMLEVANFVKEAFNFSYLMLLQPTSPLREARHIKEAYELFSKEKRPLASVHKIKYQANFIRTINNNYLIPLIKESSNILRQQGNNYYVINGAIYICFSNKIIFNEATLPYIMKKKYSIDINDKKDFKKAKKIYRRIKNNG